jgi:hypothetical protein
MKITASAVSLNVEDVAASSAFLTEHFGFREQMAADGFASLAREDAGLNVIFLRRGLATCPPTSATTTRAGSSWPSPSRISTASSRGCRPKA